MIVYPDGWKNIGQPIDIKRVEDAIFEVLSEIHCNNLSFSGGLDSSILLYFMSKIYDRVHAFTIGFSESHPDIKYSKLIANQFVNIDHKVYFPSRKEIKEEQKNGDYEGDEAVRLFYKFVGKYTDSIVAGDGIDEFMCGYYSHQKLSHEEKYYFYLEKLQKEQLIPLNENSGKIKIYLPYLDDKLILLMSQIPIISKVDRYKRKKIMFRIAIDKIPNEFINRRKYGFCDSLKEAVK